MFSSRISRLSMPAGTRKRYTFSERAGRAWAGQLTGALELSGVAVLSSIGMEPMLVRV